MGLSHRDSVAWQKGMRLSILVYELTRTFPPDERFGLTNQLRCAAVSIPSNIAEGRGRLFRRELMQFLAIARGSALEVSTQLELSVELGFTPKDKIRPAADLAEEIIRILSASITTLKAKSEPK